MLHDQHKKERKALRESCTLPLFLSHRAVLCTEHRRQKGASARLVLKRMTVQVRCSSHQASVFSSVRQKMDSEEAQNERGKEWRSLDSYLFPPKNSRCSLKQVLI